MSSSDRATNPILGSIRMNRSFRKSIRRLSRVALLALAPAIVPGCTSLTEVPEDALTPQNAFKTEEEILAGVASVYAGLRGMMWGYFNLSEITTDELVVPTRGSDWYDNGRWLEIHRQGWAANSGSALDDMNGMWNDLFSGVARANLMINVIETGTLAQAKKDTTLAELRTLRSWFYYMLQDMFGGVPLVTTTEVAQRERVTRDSVYRFMVSELTAARAHLPVSWPAAQYGRVTKGAADAILASLYINSGVFNRETGVSATAYNSCTTIVSGTTTGCAAAIAAVTNVLNAGPYSLATDWSSNFSTTNETSPENIFVVAHTAQPNLGMSIQMRGLHYNQLVPSPWNGFATIADTYRAFDAGDARRDVFLIGQQYSYNTGAAVNDRNNAPLIFTDTIANIESASEAEGARLMKYPPLAGAPDGNSHPNDFAFFRLAEMYLIRAEARNETGDQPGAIADLNVVRSRHFNPANPIPGGLNQAQVRDAIINERLFELAGEAKRRQDLIRFGRFTAQRRSCQGTSAGCIKVAAQDHKILMPIPQTQIQNNPRLVQNPGY
jgi:hypothetical protein